jgi:hypothetical protein
MGYGAGCGLREYKEPMDNDQLAIIKKTNKQLPMDNDQLAIRNFQ